MVNGVYKPTYNWGGPILQESGDFLKKKKNDDFIGFVGWFLGININIYIYIIQNHGGSTKCGC